MLSWKTPIVVALGLGAAVAVTVQAQSGGAAKPSTLTAMDYIQIKQLAARFAFAYDTGADNGCEFADLFTPDGEFEPDRVKGRDQLAALGRFGEHGPFQTSLYMMNHIIVPSPEGARGRQYVVEIHHDDNIPPVPPGESQWNLVGQKRGKVTPVGGHYEDVYVKGADGWRFKRREFVQSQGGPNPKASTAPPPAFPAGPKCGPPKKSAAASALTPMDYLEIEKVVASYGHALDNGFGKGENGDAYAGLYTHDATFGRTAGHDALAELARVQPHSATYARHYLTNHVIEGTADGAKGKQYLVVIDINENGSPGSVFLGGHYEDVYAKAPQGWRIKTRTLFRAQSGPGGTAAPTR